MVALYCSTVHHSSRLVGLLSGWFVIWLVCYLVGLLSGWVGVAGERDTMVTIKAYTPGGVGIHTRRSLLPYAVLQKGHRKRGSRSYKMKPPMRQH